MSLLEPSLLQERFLACRLILPKAAAQNCLPVGLWKVNSGSKTCDRILFLGSTSVPDFLVTQGNKMGVHWTADLSTENSLSYQRQQLVEIHGLV